MAGERLNLTSIRRLGISTTQHARAVADDLALRQLLVPVSERLFGLPKAVRQRLTEQVGTKSGSSWSQVGPTRRPAGMEREPHPYGVEIAVHFQLRSGVPRPASGHHA